jgi:pyruvate kinase
MCIRLSDGWKKRKRPIDILMDLQGPKIRVGTVRDGKRGSHARNDSGARNGNETRSLMRMSAPVVAPGMFSD